MVLDHVRKKIEKAKDVLRKLNANTFKYGSMFAGLGAPGVALISLFGPAVQHVFVWLCRWGKAGLVSIATMASLAC